MTLKNRYYKIMENINVTEEMHDRIIKNIGNTDFYTIQRKVMNFAKYKKYMAIAACFLLLVVGVVLIPNMINPNDNPKVQGIVPDIVEYNTIEELSEAVGFNVPKINQIPFEVEEVTYTVYWKELAEIEYANNEDLIIFRKSVGSEDNSGDYNDYPAINEVLINELAVTLKGNSDRCNLAIWEKDGYSYSLLSSAGVTEAEMSEMVKSVQ